MVSRSAWRSLREPTAGGSVAVVDLDGHIADTGVLYKTIKDLSPDFVKAGDRGAHQNFHGTVEGFLLHENLHVAGGGYAVVDKFCGEIPGVIRFEFKGEQVKLSAHCRRTSRRSPISEPGGRIVEPAGPFHEFIDTLCRKHRPVRPGPPPR